MPRPDRRTALAATVAVASLAILYVVYEASLHRDNQSSGASVPPNYSKIEDGYYLGGLVGEPPAGTEAVLNLCEQQDSYKCAVHSWTPIPDSAPAPSLDWLRERVKFIEEQRACGRQVYVHCAAGVSRGGMVSVAYLMAKNRWDRDTALKYVKAQRPQVNPNAAFMQLLLEWQQEVAK